MAVGLVNSQAMQPQQAAPAPQLRSGEKHATSVTALNDPKAKTFYHVSAGAKFVMPDGLELVFLGGSYRTADPSEITELEAIANKPTSQIYTRMEARTEVAALNKTVVADAGDTAGTSNT